MPLPTSVKAGEGRTCCVRLANALYGRTLVDPPLRGATSRGEERGRGRGLSRARAEQGERRAGAVPHRVPANRSRARPTVAPGSSPLARASHPVLGRTAAGRAARSCEPQEPRLWAPPLACAPPDHHRRWDPAREAQAARPRPPREGLSPPPPEGALRLLSARGSGPTSARRKAGARSRGAFWVVPVGLVFFFRVVARAAPVLGVVLGGPPVVSSSTPERECSTRRPGGVGPWGDEFRPLSPSPP